MNKTGLPILALALALTTAACSRVAPNPQTVASEYWTQMQSGNTAAAKQLVSASSRSNFEQQIKTLKPVQKFILGNGHAVVSTTLNPSESTQHQPFDTVLVLENGRWRVDASRTHLPADMDSSKQQQKKLADKLSKSIRTNLNEMNKTMHEGAQLLNNALHDGSRDMKQSLLKGIKQLNESMQHSIEQLKLRRQQQNPPPGKPNTAKGEGVI